MIRLFSIVAFVFLNISVYAQQLISYQLIRRYTLTQVDSLITAAGAGTLFSPRNGVDFYRVNYWTPYRHIDSLVRVSGAVVVPTNAICPAPLTAYFHGTNSKRTNVPSYESGESLLGILLAADGHFVAMPDYLGLGDSDSNVIVHPYIHAFSQGHTSVNMLRAARELADTLGVGLNGQLFLGGYSQGGFTTVATHKLIEEEFSNEFTITASAPMSGPYDLKEAQVDLIASDSVYATPGYLPYILLSYHSVFDNIRQLYPDISQVFKAPYDTIIPKLFYDKQHTIGFINGQSTPVPKHMIKDTFVSNFMSDSLHPLRVALAESHLLDWTPQAPIKLIYCRGDDQVTYLNSEKAYTSWTSKGAPSIEKEDYGNLSHSDCVLPAIAGAKTYLDSFRDTCSIIGLDDKISFQTLNVYPNPTDKILSLIVPHNVTRGWIKIVDISGKSVMQLETEKSVETLDVSKLSKGIYVLELRTEQQSFRKKIVVQ